MSRDGDDFLPICSELGKGIILGAFGAGAGRCRTVVHERSEAATKRNRPPRLGPVFDRVEHGELFRRRYPDSALRASVERALESIP